jgi:hypothetical protein
VDIEANIRKFVTGVKPLERDASYDYCFNYFQRFREQNRVKDLEKPEFLQESCLQLGFYLASWGMYRGSSFLLRKSARVHEPVIKAIASQPPGFWEIDAHCYTQDNIRQLLSFKEAITNPLRDYGKASDVLVTKIMLGVFGCVPAFDTNFTRGFKGYGTSTFGERSLEDIGHFYQDHADMIDKHRVVMRTIDFDTAQRTNRLYTRAKIVDMIFFIEGAR